jgi:hypothetical protein
MKNLNAYVKSDDLRRGVTTSVTVRVEHLAFIRANKLNLSRIIRDFLDEFIGQASPMPKPDGK